MLNELTDTLIIVGTILAVVGITKLTTYIMERNKFGNRKLPLVASKELTPHQQELQSTAIQVLQSMVNHRKASIGQLLNSKFINWDQYIEMYNALIKWKDEQMEIIKDEAHLHL